MTRYRPFPAVTALLLAISVLFMQFAVAAYACPSMVKMDGCAGMDMAAPSLCHAHDHSGSQSLDKPPTPAIAPFVATGMIAVIDAVGDGFPTRPERPTPFLLARATAPPVAIRNCCFRI
jgi:hypothetical protein